MKFNLDINRIKFLDYYDLIKKKRIKVKNKKNYIISSLKNEEVDIYEPEKYLYSQVIVNTFVPLEKVKVNGKELMSIKKNYERYANMNGVIIPIELGKERYKTLLGKNVYVEHLAFEGLERGKVIDVVFRKMGKDTEVWIAEALIKTEKKHKKLIKYIRSGFFSGVSKGAFGTGYCSYCGKYIEKNESCEHQKLWGKSYYLDDEGNYRLMGLVLVDIIYKELSWVIFPAFLLSRVILHFNDYDIITSDISKEEIKNKIYGMLIKNLLSLDSGISKNEYYKILMEVLDIKKEEEVKEYVKLLMERVGQSRLNSILEDIVIFSKVVLLYNEYEKNFENKELFKIKLT